MFVDHLEFMVEVCCIVMQLLTAAISLLDPEV